MLIVSVGCRQCADAPEWILALVKLAIAAGALHSIDQILDTGKERGLHVPQLCGMLKHTDRIQRVLHREFTPLQATIALARQSRPDPVLAGDTHNAGTKAVLVRILRMTRHSAVRQCGPACTLVSRSSQEGKHDDAPTNPQISCRDPLNLTSASSRPILLTIVLQCFTYSSSRHLYCMRKAQGGTKPIAHHAVLCTSVVCCNAGVPVSRQVLGCCKM